MFVSVFLFIMEISLFMYKNINFEFGMQPGGDSIILQNLFWAPLTVICTLKQPKQKILRGFSLLAFKAAIRGSKSVEKTIFQQRPLGATS